MRVLRKGRARIEYAEADESAKISASRSKRSGFVPRLLCDEPLARSRRAKHGRARGEGGLRRGVASEAERRWGAATRGCPHSTSVDECDAYLGEHRPGRSRNRAVVESIDMIGRREVEFGLVDQ